MRVIVSWSLRYRLIVLGIAAVLMLAGYTLLSRASFDTLPEFLYHRENNTGDFARQ